MNNKIIIAVICILIACAISFLFCSKNHEPYFIIPKTEANLACNLGGRTCNLHNGEPGLCDSVTRKCVAIPDWEINHVRNTSPPVGELSWECQWHDICVRSDGNMGVCMSGWCYDSSSEAK